jgi:hypothetical protein
MGWRRAIDNRENMPTKKETGWVGVRRVTVQYSMYVQANLDHPKTVSLAGSEATPRRVQ